MKKCPSTTLTIIVSVLLTLLSFIMMLAVKYIEGHIMLIAIIAISFFIISYFSIQYVLRKYILDRIKPIYNTIRELPLSGKKLEEKKLDANSLLQNVKMEVEKSARTQLKEIERLKELEKYRKDFVGNVSHELKTPIFNIQGYVLTLLEGGIEDPKINTLYLKRTEKSIDRMISIVEDLESITKLESGELKLNFTRFDIVKTVDEVVEMEHWQASENKINITIKNKPNHPVFVKADKKRILEVLTNLIVNAIKYGRRKGYVHISFLDLDDHIIVEVADNGIGIDPKDVPRIFERFYRVDKSRSREQGGTGLGLSIVKHIIEAHNQSIKVRSIPEKGTTFNFTLEKAK